MSGRTTRRLPLPRIAYSPNLCPLEEFKPTNKCAICGWDCTEGHRALDTVATQRLWEELETAARDHDLRGSNRRVNLRPHAPRDRSGRYLADALPSEAITRGPVLEAVRRLRPDLDVSKVQLNKFTDSDQCGWHFDSSNQGPSELALLGDFEGGTQ